MDDAFRWSSEKNRALRKERGVDFELIVTAIGDGQLLADLDHPNPQQYPNQRILVVDINGYAYAVPYVWDETETSVFLKTLYPSRTYTKRFLKNEFGVITDD